MANTRTAARPESQGEPACGPFRAATDRPIGLKLTVIARLIRKQFDHSTSSIGITSAQWTTISVVAGVPGATQREIAAMLEVGEVTAGRLVDRLCEEGLLERRANPVDRRSHLVYLKPAADAVLEQLTELGEKQVRRTFAGLSPQELDTLDGLLDRINDNLTRSEQDIAPGLASADLLPPAV